jgi:hypothetical protein
VIRYLKQSCIDKSKWDEAIAKSHNRLPYALSWFLDIVSPKWDALVLDDYVEVMPLTYRQKFGILYIYQPMLCQQLGVFSTIKEGSFCIDEYLEAIPRKFRLIDMAVNSMNFVSDKIQNIKIETRTNQELSLDKPYAEIRNHFSTSHVKNIKKFDGDTSVVVDATIPLSEFYRVKFESFQKKGVKISAKDSKVYFQLLNKLNERNRLKIYMAITENREMPGGICFMHFDFDRVSIQSFSDDCCKKNGFVFHFIDDFMKNNSNSNITFDFMGSSIPGIRYFNMGFGCYEISYLFLRINRLNKVLRKIKPL